MTEETWTPRERKQLDRLALGLVETCVRDSQLETLHSGVFPGSATGDYSDVKVVSPYGEIPWTQVSRISDEEMKALMIEVTNRVFTYLSFPEELMSLRGASRWDQPTIDEPLMRTVLARRARREAGEP